MKRFIVEIESWGRWEADESFDNPSEARQFARDNFPHNTWRIWDYEQAEIVAMEENGMLTTMSEEVARFRRNEEWINRFAEQRQRRAELAIVRSTLEENRRTNLGHMVSVAQRQQDRRWMHTLAYDDDDDNDEEDFTTDKVCWQKDGF